MSQSACSRSLCIDTRGRTKVTGKVEQWTCRPFDFVIGNAWVCVQGVSGQCWIEHAVSLRLCENQFVQQKASLIKEGNLPMRLRWQRFQAPCKLISLKQRHCSVCWDLWPRGRLGDARCRSRGQHGQWVKAKTLLGESPRKQGRQTQGIPLEWWIYFASIFALQKSHGMMFYSTFFSFFN